MWLLPELTGLLGVLEVRRQQVGYAVGDGIGVVAFSAK